MRPAQELNVQNEKATMNESKGATIVRDRDERKRRHGHLISAMRLEAPAFPRTLRPHHAMRLDSKPRNPLGRQTQHGPDVLGRLSQVYQRLCHGDKNPFIWTPRRRIKGEMQKCCEVVGNSVEAASKRGDGRRVLSEVRLESCFTGIF